MINAKNIYAGILRMGTSGVLDFKYFNYKGLLLFWYEQRMNTQVCKWDKQNDRKNMHN